MVGCTKNTQLAWQEQYDLGMQYLEDGDYEQAIVAFTAAIELDPKQAPIYIGRAQAYIGSGETEENLSAALTDYESALALDDMNPDIYLGIADVYIRQGDYEKAKEILRDDPSIKIVDLSAMVGFNSSNSFIRVFSKYEGITPGAYVDRIQHS